MENKIILKNNDCKNELKHYADNEFNLIVTSPPYGNKRKNTYGGIPANKYVNWFLDISKQLYRVLKPTGTFILNIKEGCKNGERETYVLELILALKKQGWLWTEEFVWHKKNSRPGKWPNRLRDSWERLLQFNKKKKFNMYQDNVKILASESTKKVKRKNHKKKYSKTNSGFNNVRKDYNKDSLVYPSNVLHLSTESKNQNHSAVFPKQLPIFFIKLFTKENDWILDPFSGSGTTLKEAYKLNRNSIGIEKSEEEYIKSLNKINTMLSS